MRVVGYAVGRGGREGIREISEGLWHSKCGGCAPPELWEGTGISSVTERVGAQLTRTKEVLMTLRER